MMRACWRVRRAFNCDTQRRSDEEPKSSNRQASVIV